jgi:hypothetical protein
MRQFTFMVMLIVELKKINTKTGENSVCWDVSYVEVDEVEANNHAFRHLQERHFTNGITQC